MSGYIAVEQVSVLSGDQVLLAPVSFSLDAGKALAVTGSNGTGKTTLLRVLAGRTPPTSGSVAIAGVPANERSSGFRARMAALIGLPPLARNLTLREHLVLVATSWGSKIADSENIADRLLDEFGILRLKERFPHELSSGQTQLFALALTLARPFEVLILDEPEQRLDSDRLELVGSVLRHLVDDGKTLIMASHSNILVERTSDEVLALTDASYDHHS